MYAVGEMLDRPIDLFLKPLLDIHRPGLAILERSFCHSVLERAVQQEVMFKQQLYQHIELSKRGSLAKKVLYSGMK
jgi:hypothetical protein